MHALFLSLERLRVDLERQVRSVSYTHLDVYKRQPTDYEPAANKLKNWEPAFKKPKYNKYFLENTKDVIKYAK